MKNTKMSKDILNIKKKLVGERKLVEFPPWQLAQIKATAKALSVSSSALIRVCVDRTLNPEKYEGKDGKNEKTD